MADSTTTIQIDLLSTADPSGVRQMKNEYDSLFDDLKQGVTEALSGQGVDPKFIGHVADEFDRLNKELQETGATGDVVAQKIAKLESNLQAAAAAEEKRIRQLKTNFEMALHEKDQQEEAATLQRIRRSEDQLAMEAEGRELKKNTELLEAEIMQRLKAKRVAEEAAQSTAKVGVAMQGARKDIGGAAMQAAYFFDDMQYGLKGVVNNIPQLAMALGLGGGLAGIISIAAVAANLLWEKFGGAKEAKAETEKATGAVDAMKQSLEGARKAAEEAFKADLKKYTDEVERAVGVWDKVAERIQKVIGHHNELAKVQNQIANSQLEIARQSALAGANTDDERKAVNTKFDASKAALNGASDIDQAQRNLAAQKAHDEMLKRQHGAVEDKRNEAMGNAFSAEKEQKDFVKQFGPQSDQGRRVAEAEAAQKRLLELQEQQRKQKDFDQARPATSGADAMARANAAEKLQADIDAAAKDRDVKNAGIAGDKEALATGKGLKFGGLEKAADAEKDPTAAAGLSQVQSEALERQKKIEQNTEASEKALNSATAGLAKIREAEAESEKALALKKLQLEAATAKDSEAFAKAGTAQVTADKEAAEKLRKQQIEEQARKYENDAAEAEANGDKQGAEDLKGRAARQRLPDDATPEQRRKIELDAKLRQAQEKQEAQDLGEKGSVIATGLGPAGKALGEAAAKLKDGATDKELAAFMAEVAKLAPLLIQINSGNAKMFAEMKKQLESLRQKLRTEAMS